MTKYTSQTVKEKYLSRVVDEELDTLLASFGAVLIEGPKWCGKTRTAVEKSASAIYLQDHKKRKEYLRTADIAPDILLLGETPRLIDEWQTIPILWDGVRFEVDQREKKGQFILTGSAVPLDNATMHTGTGRIARLFMRPMSLFESSESDGSVSLRSIFNGEDIRGVSPLTLNDLAFALVRGGWPDSVKESKNKSLKYARQYVQNIINSDIPQVDGMRKDPKLVRNLMHSLARNISTMATKRTIMNDIFGNAKDQVTEKTLLSYINALKHIFVIEDLPAWSPAIRSRIFLRTSAKHHFVDPSIAAVVLRVAPEKLMEDFNTFGLLFESLCIRDLRIYAQSMEGEVFHYHDGSDLEADAIIYLYDGRWGAVEVKMGESEIEKAIVNLKKLREKIDIDRMGEPSFLMVLTAGTYAYRRADGIYIVPIGCLRN